MGIFKRKTMITLEQLAESVVWVPHMPNQMNKVALDCLIKAFQTDEETDRVTLEVEYTAFCFSLWGFLRYPISITFLISYFSGRPFLASIWYTGYHYKVVDPCHFR